MKKVVITGATSMIGIALVEECINNNVEVLAIIRRQSVRACRLPKSDLIKIVECNMDEISERLDIEGSYDVFYHFAWEYTSKENRDNPILQEKNIKYTLDMVELAKRLGCRKFIGAGSQAEYGMVSDIITPNTNTKPVISYGIAKEAAGQLSRKLCEKYDIIHIWGRIFSVYGRYDNDGTMLVYAINQFLNKQPAVFSAATQYWDYLHASDAGKMFFCLGERAEKNAVYCIANGSSRPLKDFILEVCDYFGGKAMYQFDEQKSGAEVVSLRADISDLIRDIGYKPQVSFKEGIADMIDYKKNSLVK